MIFESMGNFPGCTGTNDVSVAKNIEIFNNLIMAMKSFYI